MHRAQCCVLLRTYYHSHRHDGTISHNKGVLDGGDEFAECVHTFNLLNGSQLECAVQAVGCCQGSSMPGLVFNAKSWM